MLRPNAVETLRAWLLSALVVHGAVAGNPDAKRLYDDLLSNYNKLVRPVVNTSDVLRVCIKLKLSQLIDVLSTKTGISNEFIKPISLKTKNFLKSERDTAFIWTDEDQIKADPERHEMETNLLFAYTPYDKAFKGFDSRLSESFMPQGFEEKYEKRRTLDERGCKSKFNSNSSETQSTKRKNSRSCQNLKSKKRNYKSNRSEVFLRKFKHVDSMKDFKRMLENFRIVSEDINHCCGECQESRHIVPAYFVLKLAENSRSNLVKGKESYLGKAQSFKLIFANDEIEKKAEKKLKDPFLSNKRRFVVKTKDELIQTSDVNDESEVGKKTEDPKNNFIEKQTMNEPKHSLDCLKRTEELKFQKEFISELLGQMKTIMAQLATIIELLNNSVKTKSADSNTKENDVTNKFFLKDTLSIKESSNKIIKKHNFETLSDLLTSCPLHKTCEHSAKRNFDDTYNTQKIFKKNSENNKNMCAFQEMCAYVSPRKHKAIFYLPHYETDRAEEKQLRKTIESSEFDAKCRCSCQLKHFHKKRQKNFLNSIKNNKNNCFTQILSETNKSADERLIAIEDQNIKKQDVTNGSELPNYENSSDEMQNEWNKMKAGSEHVKILGRKENDQNVNQKKTLNKDGLSLEETSSESNGNDALSCSNEDTANRLFSGSSSKLNLKNQIMTTNLWVEQSWYDYKLRWDPKEYGGVHMLHVPSDHIWRPDIVLYNNADGNYEVTLMTKARVSHTGLVEWQPPAVYKSSCAIDVEFFPYDIQTCVLKLGSWTYDGFKVDLRHMDEKAGSNVVEVGVDLSEFYMSVEWDILEVPAVRNEKFYTCCDEPYLDITFNITMRRKTLFYTVNIIIPCMGISFLTVLTFYLPSDSGEKVTLSISILISLHVFFLLVVEIIPPTSLVVPLLGKYLIFAMILVSISICVTVVVLNVHFRSPQTHKMAPWVKRVFIHILPRLLVMRRPQYHFEPHRFMSRRVIMQTVKGKEIQTSYYPYPYQTSAPAENPKGRDIDSTLARQRTLSKEDFSPECLADGEPMFGGSCQIHGHPPPQSESEELSLSGVDGVTGGEDLKSPPIKNPAFSHSMCPPEVHKSCFCVRFIAEHTKMLEDSTKVKEDWKYVAMVLDRLFLWIFTLAVLVGTAGIILQAPTLYDDRIPIDKQFAEIQTSTVIRCPPQ